jgi:hypothetical protein
MKFPELKAKIILILEYTAQRYFSILKNEGSQHICHQVRLLGVDHRRKIITMPPIVILTDRAIYRLCLIMQLADSF